ncbi:MAG: heavy metal translocating P-type ATPase [Bacteroidota bacterium]
MSSPVIQTQTLDVEGMTCASCVARVEKTLKQAPGVESASVNLATEKVTVTYNSEKTDLPNLARVVEDAGYSLVLPKQPGTDIRRTGEESHQQKNYCAIKRELVFSAALTAPIIAISMVSMTDWFMQWSPLGMDEVNKLLFLATTIVMVAGGKRFFTVAWRLTKHFSADMNTLVAVGTGAAYLYSTVAVLFPAWLQISDPSSHIYFDTSATIITLILLGRMLEARAKAKTADAIKALIGLQPRTARVRRNGIEMDIDRERVAVGDTVIIRPGESIPVDGVITEGRTSIDESMLTGESMPVDRTVGEKAFGGTINGSGSIELRAGAVGTDTVIAHVIRLVEEAQGSKAPIQNLVDKIASVFVPIVMGIALVTFSAWMFVGDVTLSVALMNSIAVLIIACPCALGLATPTAIMVGTGLGAKHGVLIRNAESLERIRQINTIVLDKTGTLTLGKPIVAAVVAFNASAKDDLLRLAASVETRSEHPLGRAVVEEARKSGIALAPVSEFLSAPGLGVSGLVDGIRVAAGNISYMKEQSIGGEETNSAGRAILTDGMTPLWIGLNGELAGVIGVADEVKPTSNEAVRMLKGLGLKVIMLTGDRSETAQSVARGLGIDEVIAGVRPDQKADVIRDLRQQGRVVAMVGDGVNDAPALAHADVSIAMGSGTDVAMEASDITLMNSDPRNIVLAIHLSKKTLTTIRQNLFWAFIYNIIGIPLASFGLLNPMLAAGAMAMSSVSVVTNSLRLYRTRISD